MSPNSGRIGENPEKCEGNRENTREFGRVRNSLIECDRIQKNLKESEKFPEDW